MGRSVVADARDIDNPGSVTDAEHLIDDWQESLEARAARARELGSRLAELRAEGTAEQGLVRATVGQGGQLVDLELADRVTTWPARRIAAAVLEAAAAARTAVSARAREIAADLGWTDDDAR
jgi:hypothetical protein